MENVIMTWLGIFLLSAAGCVAWAAASTLRRRDREKNTPSFHKIIKECRDLTSRNFHPNI